MDALLIILALVAGVVVGYFAHARVGANRLANAQLEADRIVADANREAEAHLKDARVTAREEHLAQRSESERELADRRAEMAKLEERAAAREASVEGKLEEIARHEQSISDREAHAKQLQEELKATRDAQVAELERISTVTTAQAREMLLEHTEQDSRREMARMVRAVEEEAKLEADRRARNILSVAIQRTASGHTAETTVSVVQLPSDDLKGRIIGREGRNIRALENLTGVDIIIDDTPQAVVLSAFDGVRREIARLTIQGLIADGRIHPSRIEEMYHQAKADIDQRIVEEGEGAALEAGVHGLHPELIKVLGRLHYRTSYGQNVLKHSVECANLAAIMAAELGRQPEDGAAGGAPPRSRQGGHARGRRAARGDLGAACQALPREPQRVPRDRGPPLRRRTADRGGRARDRLRRRIGVAAGRSRREPGRLRAAARGARGDRHVEAGASSAATRCRPAARSA